MRNTPAATNNPAPGNTAQCGMTLPAAPTFAPAPAAAAAAAVTRLRVPLPWRRRAAEAYTERNERLTACEEGMPGSAFTAPSGRWWFSTFFRTLPLMEFTTEPRMHQQVCTLGKVTRVAKASAETMNLVDSLRYPSAVRHHPVGRGDDDGAAAAQFEMGSSMERKSSTVAEDVTEEGSAAAAAAVAVVGVPSSSEEEESERI